MAATDGEGEESWSFRWADAARYAVASVVTILIVAVVVKAVMVLRPEQPLYLSVPGGSVFVARYAEKPEQITLQFHFSLRAENPSNRVHMYYTDIEGYVFSNNNLSASSNSGYVTVASFMFQPDLSLPQHVVLIRDVIVNVEYDTGNRPWSYLLNRLYEATASDGNIILDLTLRLNGTLITRRMPEGSNTTGREITFYCRPLLVGANLTVAALNKQDAFCVRGGAPRS